MNIVPVILSQLSREGRVWVKPQLNQLKGSGDIESTGDWVLGMWREGENPDLSLTEQQAYLDTVSMTILKGRRPCGQRDFMYKLDKNTTNFYPTGAVV